MPVVDYLKESFVRKTETEDISCVLYTLFHSPCDVEKKLLSASSVFSLPYFMCRRLLYSRVCLLFV